MHEALDRPDELDGNAAEVPVLGGEPLFAARAVPDERGEAAAHAEEDERELALLVLWADGASAGPAARSVAFARTVPGWGELTSSCVPTEASSAVQLKRC